MNAVSGNVMRAAGDAFRARYEGLRERLGGDATARAAAADAFARLGLPGPRVEEWRYTPLRSLAETGFHEPVMLADAAPAALAALPTLEMPRLLFVDGRFRADLSDAPAHVRVGPVAAGRLDVSLAALNGMLTEAGAAIDVPAGVDGGAVQLVSLGSDAHGHPVSFHPRHRVRLGEGARLVLVEINAGDGAYFSNPVLEIEVGAGATLVHLRLQAESRQAFHLSTVFADVAAGGTYDSFALALGGRLARLETFARLNGAEAAAHLNAAQLFGASQHGDFTTTVRHAAPNTQSRQTVKNVLTGRARGVFQGKIEVERVAQKTDGYQMNQTLLLSRDAEIDSKPQLEIYADDVKCSHGATVGELDAEQLFYLRSRGVPAEEARTMLIRAFLAEALDGISHAPTRAAFDAAIAAWWDHQP